MTDAVVIGAGHNGLVAANILADAGWSVVVLEEQAEPGGAVRSGELTLPGVKHDIFSAFYPLTAASPVMQKLDLDRWGLEWSHAPIPVAHPRPDGTCPYIDHDLDGTVEVLDRLAPGDGQAWADLYTLWDRAGTTLLDALTSLFPPVGPSLKLLARLGYQGTIDFADLTVTPLRSVIERRFRSDHAGVLLAGNALHADLAPESALSAIFGWLLTCLAQDVGFPVPVGGAARITDALVARLQASGGELICEQRIVATVIRGGRVVAVKSDSGEEWPVGKAVIADVGAPFLYRDLIGEEHLPTRVKKGIERFQYDNATVKVDWALDRPIPWAAEPARRAGTIHVSKDLDHLSDQAAATAKHLIPARPYLVVGQMDVADPSRLADGKHTAWAYTHVPQEIRGDERGELKGLWDASEAERMGGRIEDEIERLAPGFRDTIAARHVLTPPLLEERNSNLVGGALNGGTSQLHQQLVFRPVPGLARPGTPIHNLYLGSSSAHPGGGVHGACGSNAATAALAAEDRTKRIFTLGAVATATAALGLRKIRRGR